MRGKWAPTACPAKLTQLEGKLSTTDLPLTVQAVLWFQLNVPMCKCLRQKTPKDHSHRDWRTAMPIR